MSQKTKPQITKKQPRSAGPVGTLVDRALGVVIDALSTDAASATKLLAKQHSLVKALFEKIERAPTHKAKLGLFEELATNLVAHDAIEREIFYPACEKAMGMTDLLGEALVEHGVVEFCVYEAEQAGERDFAFKCQVLSEIVLHHVREEERDFFPRAEKALGKARLEQLGAQMRARFEQAKGEDFRSAVYTNLKQVLAGTLKPTKRTAAKKKAASNVSSQLRPARASGTGGRKRAASSKAARR